MKLTVICIIVALLLIWFGMPGHLSGMFNPSNRLTLSQAQEATRLLTGGYPSSVPLMVLGSPRDAATCELEGALQRRNLAFTPIDLLLNPQARPLMNRLSKQDIPVTIVGTYIISGCHPDEVEKALMLEQKSLNWPVPSAVGAAGGATTAATPATHGGDHAKATKHRH